jgi:hypothetical protein
MDATEQSVSSVVKENRKNDITFKLRPKTGGAAGSTGMVDKQLFTGGNTLHAILDRQTMLWGLTYENGVLPQALQQRFTGLTPLYKTVKDYYDKRNVDIVEIID